ncbi:chalcone isomerase family protein [Aromatoleum petrolei]|uniref:Chalcone isomerase domain-containing protein n=1 Tax=Aromatoleum petrolei TaxID=76116 RepID=A0ABX1MMY8_9RHOO|nr:chalcone isomerase family protein [Aromatoleum petrolei]NMF87414.1 hypothetical protein [Aromatoleum petrolei]QTQ35780.1 Chalcone isomerase-like superfamily protein [Aromatoleum petrolei]
MSITSNSPIAERAGVRSLLRACALACMLAGAHASAGEREVSTDLPPALPVSALDGGWGVVGQGTMRWFGLPLYEASLWTRGAEPWRAERPFALEIRYARSIRSERLVAASLDEMERLGFADAARREHWRPLLERAFPSVEAGDTIVGLAQPDGRVVFYHRGAPTAELRDAAFARAFFAIWLDPRTREPGLRARLLGIGDEG